MRRGGDHLPGRAARPRTHDLWDAGPPSAQRCAGDTVPGFALAGAGRSCSGGPADRQSPLCRGRHQVHDPATVGGRRAQQLRLQSRVQGATAHLQPGARTDPGILASQSVLVGPRLDPDQEGPRIKGRLVHAEACSRCPQPGCSGKTAERPHGSGRAVAAPDAPERAHLGCAARADRQGAAPQRQRRPRRVVERCQGDRRADRGSHRAVVRQCGQARRRERQGAGILEGFQGDSEGTGRNRRRENGRASGPPSSEPLRASSAQAGGRLDRGAPKEGDRAALAVGL